MKKSIQRMEMANKDNIREYCSGCRKEIQDWSQSPCDTCVIEIKITNYEAKQ